jgi:hypothetical protein
MPKPTDTETDMQGTVPAPQAATAVVACRVVEDELRHLSAGLSHIVAFEFFEVGLHDRPAELRAQLQAAIERCEERPEVSVIVLGYGLCGTATVGLTPGRCRLVLPRAHDCVTLFLGSKEKYSVCMAQEPGTYWYCPGWNKSGRSPGPDREKALREEYTQAFGASEAGYLIETERTTLAQYTTAAYTSLGLPADDEQRRYAETCAKWQGWQFRQCAGDASLLRDLLSGPWTDDRFVVVRPGETVAHSPDEWIAMVAPADVKSLNQPVD